MQVDSTCYLAGYLLTGNQQSVQQATEENLTYIVLHCSAAATHKADGCATEGARKCMHNTMIATHDTSGIVK